MSFPSAIEFLRAMGATPETATPEQASDALLRDMETDTPSGFQYVEGLVEAFKGGLTDAVTFVAERIQNTEHRNGVLRSERIAAGGLKVDVAPGSPPSS